MAIRSDFIITDLGTALMARSMANATPIIFTAVKAANGYSAADETDMVTLAGATVLDLSVPSISYNAVDGSVVFDVTITNENTVTKFDISEYGVFAKTGADANSILFGYMSINDTKDTLFPYTAGNQHFTRTFKCITGSTNDIANYCNPIYNNDDMVDKLKFKSFLYGVLGVAQHSLSNDLPDATGNWGWFDGGEIKKADYPDLWLRVKPDVDTAIANVTSGTWEYLGSNNLKSYYGWYKGTTDEYFRKPNVMDNSLYMRPSSSRNPGVFQTSDNLSHTHGASTGAAGSHNHTTDSQGNHSHSYYLGGNGGNDNINMPSASDAAINYQYYTTPAAGAHTHTSTTTGSHTHSVLVTAYGNAEATPKNIGVRVYGLLRCFV